MKKQKPKEPPFNVLEFYEKYVKDLPRSVQINWLRFEYVRRNPEYREDFDSLFDIPGVKKDGGNRYGYRWKVKRISPLEQRLEDISKKWEIPTVCTPDRPFPFLENITIPVQKLPSKLFQVVSKNIVVESADYNFATKYKNEIRYGVAKCFGGSHKAEFFQMKREGDGLTYDEKTWRLVAINRKAGDSEIIEELKRLGILRGKTKGPKLEDRVKRLRVWDLRQKGVFTLRDISEMVYSDPCKEPTLSNGLRFTQRDIDGGYKAIR
ncbi:MAG: hypothetical protein ABIH23_32140 [bacterium]